MYCRRIARGFRQYDIALKWSDRPNRPRKSTLYVHGTAISIPATLITKKSSTNQKPSRQKRSGQSRSRAKWRKRKHIEIVRQNLRRKPRKRRSRSARSARNRSRTSQGTVRRKGRQGIASAPYEEENSLLCWHADCSTRCGRRTWTHRVLLWGWGAPFWLSARLHYC